MPDRPPETAEEAGMRAAEEAFGAEFHAFSVSGNAARVGIRAALEVERGHHRETMARLLAAEVGADLARER